MSRGFHDPLPRLAPDERIYIDFPDSEGDVARSYGCAYDRDRDKWFTGPLNQSLPKMMRAYGISDITADNAVELYRTIQAIPVAAAKRQYFINYVKQRRGW